MTITGGHVMIGGGTGFIGSYLCRALRNNGHEVKIISRMPALNCITWHDLQHKGLPAGTKAVVNLAGQNVLDPTRRWTPGFKQNVWNSRIRTTKSIANAIIEAKEKPSVFVAMSAVGIYKPDMEITYSEESEIRNGDFFVRLCEEWEKAGQLPKEISCRHVSIRSGIVLGRDGGMIKHMYVPFFLGLGGRMGDGKQFLPWIHIDDLVNLILFAIDNEHVEGILNGVAPQPITNQEFTNVFAKVMSRPAVFPVPKLVLNVMLNEERAKMVLEGQKVLPKRTEQLGFKFNYPDIESACRALVKGDT